MLMIKWFYYLIRNPNGNFNKMNLAFLNYKIQIINFPFTFWGKTCLRKI
jgi:hypothetical protein